MKTKISAAAIALLFITATAFGHDRNRKPFFSSKEVAIESYYKKITVGSNIRLVLLPAGQQATVTVTGDLDRVNDVTVKMNKDEMIISSRKSVKSGSIVVYVPATDLSYINLKAGASVSSMGDLKFSDLTVFVNVDSRMDLKLAGNVRVQQAYDCDFIYEKKETAAVGYVKQ
jgi:hypothetical protein